MTSVAVPEQDARPAQAEPRIGWLRHRLAAGVASGLLLWTTFPPLEWGLFAWIALAPLFWLATVRGASARTYLAAWAGGLVAWNDLVPTLTLYLGVLACLLWPGLAPLIAGASVIVLLGYLAWRSRHPRPREGWRAWLTGDWAPRAWPVWRWLTGDFIT